MFNTGFYKGIEDRELESNSIRFIESVHNQITSAMSSATKYVV